MTVRAVSFLLLFLAINGVNYAQLHSDSLVHKVNSVSQRFRIDSIENHLQPLPDSLLPSFHKLDSIRTAFNLTADSIQTTYERAVSKIDAKTGKINQC